MNALYCENGFDFATENTKGTKDCRNGFFFAVSVFIVAKNPFGRHFVVSDSAGAVAAEGFNPRSMRLRGGQRSARPTGNPVCPGRYRSVTLGNGDVWGTRPSRLRSGASRAAHSNQDVSGGTPNTAGETPALPSQCNSNRFKAFQTDSNQKKKKLSLNKHTFPLSVSSVKSVVQLSGAFAMAFRLFSPPLWHPAFGWIRSRKNQGGSRLLKVDQGESRHFETFLFQAKSKGEQSLPK